MSDLPPLQPERTVLPRKRDYKRRPVVAVHNGQTLDENGELSTVDQLVIDLPKIKSTIFVSQNSADLLASFDLTFAKDSTWQWKIQDKERTIKTPQGRTVASRVTTSVYFFGWRKHEYHKMLDPIAMYGKRLDEVFENIGDDIIVRLLKWGVAIRDFCDDSGIEVRPTTGAISAQFLTHSSFYPDARRKVPKFINEATREHMPGNYYRLMVEPDRDKEFTAYYLDQSRAHHYHAAHIRLPSSNHLYAYGRYADLQSCVWDTTQQDFCGLYCVDLVYKRKGQRAYGWIKGYEPRLTRQFVWSNELSHLNDMGFTVSGVYAAWGSRMQDTGLPKYAKWALSQLDKYEDATWLKPLLLSAYGVLAITPRNAEAVYKMAKSGEPTNVLTGRYSLDGIKVRSQRKLEPRIANVLHRGMIEAATRSESVGLAQYLTGQGHTILSIYADAVIVLVEEDRELPYIPEPWRLKKKLNHLQFINQQAFISGEMTKLPGVSREILEFAHTRRPPVPRLPVINVEELMEQEEVVNTLITNSQRN